MEHNLTRRGLAAMAAAPAFAQSRSSKPNILLILSDDHSVPYLGAYGNRTIQTPNLDKFASEGMRFDKAFTAAPQCVPSRTAIMTGRSPVSCRMGRFTSPLPPDITTLPEELRKSGYFTGVCRRWFHLDGPARPGPVSSAIFDRHGMRTWDRRVDWLDKNSTRAQTVARVSEFLDKKPKDKPFFLWVNFNDPHHVWDRNAIPKPHDPAAVHLPGSLPDLPGMRADLGRHCDEIARMDSEFQSVLDTVSQRGAMDNTIVMFMGDNGYAFPHGKGSLYDPGLNVPLLVRWFGRVKAGASTSTLVSGEDLAPTLLSAAGARAPESMTGQSFLGALTGGSHEPRKHIFAARLTHGGAPYQERASGFDLSRCARSERYKFIYNCTPHQQYWPVDSGGDAGWQETLAAHKAGKLPAKLDRAYFSNPRPVHELYDLQSDPDELDNLAGRPELAAVQRELTVALQEKMIVDYDFLPLPLNE